MLRRRFVQALFPGAMLGFAVPPVTTQQKLSQAAAEYQSRPRNGLTCAACSLFRKPRACEVVEGDISPSGWCRFFDLPD